MPSKFCVLVESAKAFGAIESPIAKNAINTMNNIVFVYNDRITI